MTSIEPFAGPPHKDRFLAALRGARTDRVPHFEILIEDQHVQEYVAAAQGTGIGVVLLCASIFQTIYEFAVGLNDCMVMIMEECDLFEEMMSRSADYYAEFSRRAVEAGIDVLFCADDFAWKTGFFVRPKLFEAIWRPHYDRIMAPARAAKIPIVFHSDGNLDADIGMLREMGVSAVHPMDPSGIDYRDFKKRHGSSLTLFGNIDITWPLVQGTPADVERDVRDHMEALKPGGRQQPQHCELHPPRKFHRHDQRFPQIRQVLERHLNRLDVKLRTRQQDVQARRDAFRRLTPG